MKNLSKIEDIDIPESNENMSDGDRRSDERQISILRLAKIEANGGAGWGFIKNISSTGMMLEIHAGFKLDDRIAIILTDDYGLSGEVRWRKGTSVGIEFDNEIDISEVLARTKKTDNGRYIRLPRVQMKYPINLRKGITPIKAEICDISPGGLCVRTDYKFEIGNRVTLLLPEMSDIVGSVRWLSNDFVGIAFQERISISNLMAWLSGYYAATMANNGDTSIS